MWVTYLFYSASFQSIISCCLMCNTQYIIIFCPLSTSILFFILLMHYYTCTHLMSMSANLIDNTNANNRIIRLFNKIMLNDYQSYKCNISVNQNMRYYDTCNAWSSLFFYCLMFCYTFNLACSCWLWPLIFFLQCWNIVVKSTVYFF